MKPEAGHVVSGTLRLVRKIADGGMGSGWIAEHLVLGREVAVKFVSGPWASVPEARARFLREARMTAQIDSPHVVRVLDCRLDEADEPYLVLELLHGETLEQCVRRHGPRSVYEVVEIVSQVCEALAASHATGVVHRDLKPENVFLVAGSSPFVKVLDFGVAKPLKAAECIACDHLPAGTPRFMSPEHMFEPEKTDERSDLFSLAAVAYFALTRRAPFDADSMEALYFAIDGGTFTRPSSIRPELPAALDRWFERALAHDPKDRFPNARTMADALLDAMREGGAKASTIAPTALGARPSPSERTTEPDLYTVPLRRMKRPRGMLALAFAAAAMVALVAWVGGGAAVPEANAAPPVLDGGIDGELTCLSSCVVSSSR